MRRATSGRPRAVPDPARREPAFAGGLLFGRLAEDYRSRLLLAAEGTGDTFALITWVIFGATVVGWAFEQLTWDIAVYALLSLTVIRMLPVYLALGGMGLRASQKLFIGWFGPRGLASIVFAVIILNEHLPGGSIIVRTAAWTIILSILAHGLSANPLVAALAVRTQKGVRG